MDVRYFVPEFSGLYPSELIQYLDELKARGVSGPEYECLKNEIENFLEARALLQCALEQLAPATRKWRENLRDNLPFNAE